VVLLITFQRNLIAVILRVFSLRYRNGLLCVEWGVKPYTLTHLAFLYNIFISLTVSSCRYETAHSLTP